MSSDAGCGGTDERHAPRAAVLVRFSRYFGSQLVAFEEATTAWLRSRAASCASLVEASGCSKGSACGQ